MATSPATAPDTAPSAVGVPFCCPFDKGPGESGGSCGDRCRDEGGGGQFVGRQGAARIEPEPAEPEKRSAQDGEGQVVRGESSLFETDPLPISRARTRAETPELVCTTIPPAKSSAPRSLQPAAHSPDPVSERIVHEGRPENRESEKRRKFDALGICPDDERRRDDRKHALKDHEGIVRDRRRVIGVGLSPHVPQARPVEISDDSVPGVRTEGQGVSV